MNDYRVLYVKEGDDGWWLEHCGGKWQLKQKEHKGKDLAWATVVGGCALEACGSRVWRVSVSKGAPWEDDEDIKIAVGGDALAKVNTVPHRLKTRAKCSTPPHATAT